MIDNATKIESSVLAVFPGSTDAVSEDALLDLATSLRRAFPVDDTQFDALVRRLQHKLAITMQMGVFIAPDFHPWLANRKASIDPFYSTRFSQYLRGIQKWSPNVVSTLDRVSDEILDLAGDPTQTGNFARRGLIVGDVQSGKTAMYTALTCKAADAKYGLIVLLTGTIESLRRQTQLRMDEGFVGRDSSELLESNKFKKTSMVGVGTLDSSKTAVVFTSRQRDFNASVATNLGIGIKQAKEPILMVCKKNPKILENLRLWLEKQNAINGVIDASLLLIDDEADSASINTNADDVEATRTNREIRTLLKLFARSSYVGVTATPFANVFIQPDTQTDMEGDDLFPRDYIYALEAPVNYIGPVAVFHDETNAVIRTFDDSENTFPLNHKQGLNIVELPHSLEEAIHTYLLATVIRDLRGEGPTHRSMLINVSRFTAVQDLLVDFIDSRVREMQQEFRLYAKLPGDDAIKESPVIRRLHTTWEYEFADVSKWTEIQDHLVESLSPVVVKAVNQRAGSANLDYHAYRDSGLRVIAIGGNSLSRGLTLEGLSTSYFLRNSKMYDTLLQMGRWFGYRPGYEDLCRLWMTEEAVNWYSHITGATQELRAEFLQMRQAGLRPIDFGLKVRSHPDSLIVTARNKMRSGKDYIHMISLSSQLLETVRLRSRPDINSANIEAARHFITSVRNIGSPKTPRGKGFLWSSVPKDVIANFMKHYNNDPLNFKFQMNAIADYLLATAETKLATWDVMLASGSGAPFEIEGLTISTSRRTVLDLKDTGSILISGTKARVGSGGSEREGLTDYEEEQAKFFATEDGKGVADLHYRRFRSRPLLLMYFISGTLKIGNKGFEEEIPFRPGGEPLLAFGLSFPNFDDSAIAKKVPYRINIVEWRQFFATDIGIEDNDEQMQL